MSQFEKVVTAILIIHTLVFCFIALQLGAISQEMETLRRIEYLIEVSAAEFWESLN